MSNISMSTESFPCISIVTPSFNQGQYLEKTIDSVLSQNYPNLEYIIIDGGSKDNSVDIIKKYEKYLTYWISEPDRGQSHAINKGFARATGDLYTWLNSDDWFTFGALDKFRSAYHQNPDAGVFVGIGQIVDTSGEVIYYKEPNETISLDSLYHWLNGGDFMQPSSMFTRKAWLECGPLDETIHIAFDTDFWLRLAKAGFQFVTIMDLLSEALSHPNAKTTAFKNLMLVDCALVIASHGGDFAVRKQLSDMAHKLSWLQTNYDIIVNHPVLKWLRPIVKRLGKPGTYWQSAVPSWIKD